ncbi:hypothetical protein L596_003541 [Steinernema carpocapsae]|uniref:Uncharacterized protein n=1 Tax=Steinernema carpocapsae TaxID=34508 RepID=A0A4U8UUI4_STECR|nr:hypothetical protein L596_003541 [Steinernema carpocapsae]
MNTRNFDLSACDPHDVDDEDLGVGPQHIGISANQDESVDSSDSRGYDSGQASCAAEEDAVPDGFLRLELTTDILNQLCGFFAYLFSDF